MFRALADTLSQMQFRTTVVFTPVPDTPAPPPSSESVPIPQRTRHSPDFRSVNWFGTAHSFSPTQAAIVRVLWMAWQNGTPDVSEEAILREADSDSDNIRMLFRKHDAYGQMIQRSSHHGGSPGCFRLVEPTE